MHLSPASEYLATVFNIRLRPQCQTKLIPSHTFPTPWRPSPRSSFSTCPARLAKSGRPQLDPRIRMIRYHLQHPLTPRPLRFSRLRSLRHWTIHRAAQLLLHKNRFERERALERQYNAMRAACEELRLGLNDGGRLYRQAITKKGHYGGLKTEKEGAVVGNGGIPIEFARAQTESPPRGGFDESWTRG